LCVAKVRPGGHGYYLDVVDTGVEAPGEWLSAGAEVLDLRGDVKAHDLESVLAGAEPSSGKRLGRSHERVKVAGFDLTFCAPKSVSLLHALGDADVASAVRSGHDRAVRETLSYIERRALGVRRGSRPERAVLNVEGVAAGGFVHRTSRALDPHLHTHVVVANLGLGPEGTWSALDGRGVYAHAPAAGALYHAQLRHELTRRLGVGWGPLNGGRADIVGIGPEVRRAFSQRAAAIEAHLAERGLANEPRPRARAVAAFATRAPKDSSIAPESLRGWWQERAREVGLSPRLLEATLGRVTRHVEEDRERGVEPTRSAREGRSRDPLEDAVRGMLSELGRSVTRRDIVRAWSSALEKGAPAQTVELSADRLVSSLGPVDGWHGVRDGPGVDERRHVVEPRGIERDLLAERRRIDRHLAARGMSRSDHRSLELGRDTGLGLSW
jgi:conjugative relaxase-like TrwC/TraI family protein